MGEKEIIIQITIRKEENGELVGEARATGSLGDVIKALPGVDESLTKLKDGLMEKVLEIRKSNN